MHKYEYRLRMQNIEHMVKHQELSHDEFNLAIGEYMELQSLYFESKLGEDE